jgi:PEGA domain
VDCGTPALLMALLLLAAPAAAQVSSADRATARALAQQGQEALENKDWATAAERFGRADALVHAPTLMLALARAEVGQGRWVAALEHYSRIAREGVAPGSPPAWSKALQDAQRELAALEPRVPAVILHVEGAAEARVSIDGTPVPVAAIGVNRPVDPGKRTLHAEADGYAPVEVTVTLAERQVETVTLRLEVAPAASTVPAPPPPPPPPPGRSPLKAVGLAGIGVGGAGLILGAIAGGMALGKHGELQKICPSGHCTDQQSAITSYDLVGGLATAGFVAGGILAATGVVLVIVAPRERAHETAWIAPRIGPGYAGVEGRF